MPLGSFPFLLWFVCSYCDLPSSDQSTVIHTVSEASRGIPVCSPFCQNYYYPFTYGIRRSKGGVSPIEYLTQDTHQGTHQGTHSRRASYPLKSLVGRAFQAFTGFEILIIRKGRAAQRHSLGSSPLRERPRLWGLYGYLVLWYNKAVKSGFGRENIS